MAEERIFTDTEICLKSVDEYEVLYDERQEHLLRKLSTKISFLDNPEAFKNLQKCQEVLLMCIKQRVILNEPVVRFHHKNDIGDLQAKIVEVGLSNEVNAAIRDISKVGYEILKDANILDILVEFDAERFANIVAFGKTLKIGGYFDMLALVDDSEVKQKVKLREQKKKRKPKSSKSRLSYSSGKQQTKSDSNFEDIDSDELDEVVTVSEDTISSRNLGRAAVTVVMTARNQVPAKDIYRQLLFSHLHTLSKFYILAFHIGPLVEKQAVVLYEYNIPKALHKLVKSKKHCEGADSKQTEEVSTPAEEFYVSLTVQKTCQLGPSNSETTDTKHLNLHQLEDEFRGYYGRQLQQLAPFKDYFRYVVYDCPGIKDHRVDNKARYERYMAKREIKKNERRKKKEQEIQKDEEEMCETSRTMVSSKNGEVGSIMGVLNRVDEINSESVN